MDELTYNYGEDEASGNQLRKVSDGADPDKGFTEGADVDDDYTYDRNGNMTVDNNKSIKSITYNFLNLPRSVTKTTGESIVYVYDATGRKLSQVVRDAVGKQTKQTTTMESTSTRTTR